ncbi:hypothetical protein [Nocardioides bruguierae]|uniref:Uncharacterized protein n=1 Tax=Nocardioides bruguierae TaxID=2945102 RepID=A0A9X2IG41_9ACTN|nr:hypothetical protein [Nocardioides bruguierae]MCM0622491.1 hypothetical protein [Nocardioides bruguierae]
MDTVVILAAAWLIGALFGAFVAGPALDGIAELAEIFTERTGLSVVWEGRTLTEPNPVRLKKEIWFERRIGPFMAGHWVYRKPGLAVTCGDQTFQRREVVHRWWGVGDRKHGRLLLVKRRYLPTRRPGPDAATAAAAFPSRSNPEADSVGIAIRRPGSEGDRG